jgi:hypothetical protein
MGKFYHRVDDHRRLVAVQVSERKMPVIKSIIRYCPLDAAKHQGLFSHLLTCDLIVLWLIIRLKMTLADSGQWFQQTSLGSRFLFGRN